MAASSVLRYDERMTADESFVDHVLKDDFSLASLKQLAANDGYDISDEDWQAYLSSLDLPTSRMHVLVHSSNGQIVEIGPKEIDKVSGADGEWGDWYDYEGLYGTTFMDDYAASRAWTWAAVWAVAVVSAGAAVNVAVYANAVAVTLVVVAGAAVVVVVAV